VLECTNDTGCQDQQRYALSNYIEYIAQKQKITRLPSNLKPTICKCVHLFTRSYSWSCNEDGGHAIRFAVAEKTICCTQSSPLCLIEKELFSLCGKVELFGCSFMLREYALFIYDLDPYCLEIHRMCKYELPMWRLLKLIDWQKDRQKESIRIINHAASRVVKNCHTFTIYRDSMPQRVTDNNVMQRIRLTWVYW